MTSDSAASLPQQLRAKADAYGGDNVSTVALLRSAADALERAREALDLFRYAHTWVSADSWDWTSETRSKFQDAAALADGYFGKLTDDEIARIGQRHASRVHAPQPTTAQEEPTDG